MYRNLILSYILCVVIAHAYIVKTSPILKSYKSRTVASIDSDPLVVKNTIPRLVLISGGTGTGKSSLAMSLAFSNNFKKCVSTDTIREIARSYSTDDELHRPSYGGQGEIINDWKGSVHSLKPAVSSIVGHTLRRRKSMILEGVAISPSNEYIKRWRELDGTAVGILVKISDRQRHRDILVSRGYYKQIANFERIRAIQSEMIKEATQANWLQLELTDIDSMVKQVSDYLHSEEYKLDSRQ